MTTESTTKTRPKKKRAPAKNRTSRKKSPQEAVKRTQNHVKEIEGNTGVVAKQRSEPVSVEEQEIDPVSSGRSGKRNPRGSATVPKQYRLFPDVAAALERAAAEEGVSTSRYLNQLLADHLGDPALER